MKECEWDDPILPFDVISAWNTWEEELPNLDQIRIPQCYGLLDKVIMRELHVFCDASEKAYGPVAYLGETDEQGQSYLAFVMAGSRVPPKRQLTMPGLELCAASSGAQLAKLTLPLNRTVLWSDSTTVLTWIHSETCHYKVFVANRIAEIVVLTNSAEWKHVQSSGNPADDITRGKKPVAPHCWATGPPFLHLPSDQWPMQPPNARDNIILEPGHIITPPS